MRHLLCLSFLFLPVAAMPDEKPADDPHRAKPGDAPTPYTADEIRKACPEGRTDVFRTTFVGANLRGPSMSHVKLSTQRWAKCDEKGAEVETVVTTEDGTNVSSSKKTSTWKEMQESGSFPESDTKITEETIEVPAGKFDCWVYTVTQKIANQMTTRRIYFAKTLAGPPVKWTHETTGTLGTVGGSMTMIEHKAPAEGEKPGEGVKPPAKPAGG